mgnify:CR=1 FL=1
MNKSEKKQIKQMLKSHDKMVNWQSNMNSCIMLIQNRVNDLKFQPDGKIVGLKEVYYYIDRLEKWNDKFNKERSHHREKLALLDNPNAHFMFPPTQSNFEWSDMPYKNWHKGHFPGNGKPYMDNIEHLKPKSV